jgi:hypothetical protein
VRTLSWQVWLSPSGPRVSHFRFSILILAPRCSHFRSLIADSRGVRGCSRPLIALPEARDVQGLSEAKYSTFGEHKRSRLYHFRNLSAAKRTGSSVLAGNGKWFQSSEQETADFRVYQVLTRDFRACQRPRISGLARDERHQGLQKTMGFQSLPETRNFGACQRRETSVLAKGQGFKGLPETGNFRACQRRETSGLAKDQGFQGLPETQGFGACQRKRLQGLPDTRDFRSYGDQGFQAQQRPYTSGSVRDQACHRPGIFMGLPETRDFSTCQRPGIPEQGISMLAGNLGFQGLLETRDFML